MQVFANNLSMRLAADLPNYVYDMVLQPADHDRLKELYDGAVQAYGDAQIDLTLDDGTFIEIVRVLSFYENGADRRVVVLRAQQGTTSRDFLRTRTKVEMRVTAGFLNTLHHMVAARIATDGSQVLLGANGEVLTH